MIKNAMTEYPHAMLREIYEQPEALTRTLSLYLDKGLHPADEDLSAGSWASS